MVYQLDLKKDELRLLSRAWEVQVRPIHPAWPMAENWRPDTHVATLEAEGGFREHLVDEEDDLESDEEDREDDELLDALEDFGLLDEYQLATLTDDDEQEGQWNGAMAEGEEDVLDGGIEDMYLFSSSPVHPNRPSPSPSPTKTQNDARWPDSAPTVPKAHEHARSPPNDQPTHPSPTSVHPTFPKAHEHSRWLQNDVPTPPGPTSAPNG
ncbi:hypothetical protein PAXINDRAFT_16400 [Paxillus involutus ATCC 200175]|uniref:Uncharacterized protein n=1 Tax=Paxillus involutus ATCC 200175 TaxID=664439 RepID=A0A0C9TS66_PAXIN|nr:hypothetical protein PAXINDRAFT_16400 [Paxillus involutus ATCC 200175]